MPDLLLLLIGLLAIIAGAELLVRTASRLAVRLGVPPLVIGLTVVSIGTSAPELAIGVDAALRDAGPLSVGNVAGTNTLTLLLILGTAAIIRPITVRSEVIRLHLPVLVGVATLVAILAADGALGRIDGIALAAAGVVYAVVVGWRVRRDRRAARREFVREFGDLPREAQRPGAVVLEVLGLLGGIVVVVLAAEWLVDGAVGIARSLDVSEAVIGLTIVALGTSAPELTTTIVATLRGARDVAIGNLLGSAIVNLVLILGVTALVADPAIPVDGELLIDLVVMAAAALVCVPVLRTGARIQRLEGVGLVVAYLGYLAWLLLART